MNTLRLPLKKKWFEMTKALIKGEDYRKINDYWCRKLLDPYEEIEWHDWCDLINELNDSIKYKHENTDECLKYFGVKIKKFDTTTLTLGYPSNSDKERIIEFENLGISIGYGKEEWGAEKDKLYFIIKHGKRVN